MKVFLGQLFSPAYAKAWMGSLGTVIASVLLAATGGDAGQVAAVGAAIGGFMSVLLVAFGPANSA